MQIIIPAAGRGTRFQNSSFISPKPLIEWDGLNMIEHVVDNFKEDGVRMTIIAQKSHNIRIDGINLIEIEYYTDGPASSAILAESYIDMEDELIITNCDQIIEDWNLPNFSKFVKNYDAVLGCFISDSPKNSYVKIGSDNIVTEVREKQVISNIATNGLHYWKKAKYFFESVGEMIDRKDSTNGEYYVAPTYNYLIERGQTVGIFMFNQHFPIGTPEDLKFYLSKYGNSF